MQRNYCTDISTWSRNGLSECRTSIVYQVSDNSLSRVCLFADHHDVGGWPDLVFRFCWGFYHFCCYSTGWGIQSQSKILHCMNKIFRRECLKVGLRQYLHRPFWCHGLILRRNCRIAAFFSLMNLQNWLVQDDVFLTVATLSSTFSAAIL